MESRAILADTSWPARAKLSAVVVPALLAIGIYSMHQVGYELDDALIYRRYILNLFQSGELVFNPGERFNALSSPLFSYLLILLTASLGNVSAAQLAASSCGMVLTVIGSALLFAGTLSFVSLLTLTALVSTSDLIYRTYGLESTLFLGLGLLAIWSRTEKPRLYPTIGALLLLTRGEGIFLLAVLELFNFKNKKISLSLKCMLPAALLIILHVAFQWWYYGSPIPATLTAKMAQGASGYWGTFPLFPKFGFLFDWYGIGPSDPVVIAFLLVAIFGCTAILNVKELRYFGAFALLLALFYTALNIPPYHWYFVPLLYLLYLLFSFGIQKLVTLNLPVKFPYALQSSVLGVLIAFPFVFLQARATYGDLFSTRPEPPYRSIGKWLSEHTAANAKIGAVEVGTLGVYSGRYIIDILGVTSPKNAEFLAAKKMNGWLKVYTPDYILVHNPPWPQERAFRKVLKAGEFKRVLDFEFPGFQLIQKQDLERSSSVRIAPEIVSEHG